MRPPFSSVNQYTQAAVKQHTHNTLKVPNKIKQYEKINNGYPYIVLRKNSYIECAISISKQAYQNSQLDHCQKRCRPTNNGHFKQTHVLHAIRSRFHYTRNRLEVQRSTITEWDKDTW